MEDFTAHTVDLKGQKTLYYEAGPSDATPLIFIHGWPGIAETWKHQLTHFTSLGYRVIAPDMRGYGGSSSPSDKRAYSLDVLVSELVDLLPKLNLQKAVWVSHDWGAAVASALASHHPELVLGLVLISVPYRSLELSVNHIINLVNRDIYPESEYPHGQWSYMKFYERNFEHAIQQFETHTEKATKLFFKRTDKSTYGKVARTATVEKAGSWFGVPAADAPDIPLASTVLDEHLYSALLASFKDHGFGPPTAYYPNHDVNEEYAKTEKNGGHLSVPVLFIDTKYDAICSITTTPKMGEEQGEYCENLVVEYVEGGHWGALECPGEVNGVLKRWLDGRFGEGT